MALPPCLVIVGPTASGKTDAAIEAARRTGGEIVSADSMQLYRGMDIGTAKPTADEQRGVRHHLLDALEIGERSDAAHFRQLALEAIAEIRLRGAFPIVVGGSGLYIRALTRGVFEGPGRDDAVRARLEMKETSVLHANLERVDPVAAAKIGARDRRRLIRALEFFEATGEPISARQTQWSGSQVTEDATAPRVVGLNRAREDLYYRCERRVDRMFASGLMDEVRELLGRGLATAPTASKAIGYADAIRHLSGTLSLEETIALVKKKTRQYAKRQLTWFRKEPGITWVNVSAEEKVDSIAKRVITLMEAHPPPS